MINFYPGPSKINKDFTSVASELLESGLVTYNHRSTPFMEGYAYSVKSIKSYLSVPEDHEVVFLSSATECWELISRQFRLKQAQFFLTGAFSKKWCHTASQLFKTTHSINLSLEKKINHISEQLNTNFIAYVDCETSNGYKIPIEFQKELREKNPQALIAVDATSSLGGTPTDFTSRDITFASVQKCLGFPPGLAVMILSPQAVKEIRRTKTTYHYNDLNNVLDNHLKNQTTHTPNTLLILALGKVFQNKKLNPEYIEQHSILLEEAVRENKNIAHFIPEEKNRSKNVICLKHKSPSLFISEAYKAGFILGKGYGSLISSTFRIANFPSHTTSEIKKLCNFISSCTT